jgi:hypothetical protein
MGLGSAGVEIYIGLVHLGEAMDQRFEKPFCTIVV